MKDSDEEDPIEELFEYLDDNILKTLLVCTTSVMSTEETEKWRHPTTPKTSVGFQRHPGTV